MGCIQEEALTVPASVDSLLSDYAKRFNEVKTPRKLLWKKNLGTVKVSAIILLWCPIIHVSYSMWLVVNFCLNLELIFSTCSPFSSSISPTSTYHLLPWIYCCSWSCNLMIEQFNSQWHLYMQQLLCIFRIKHGKFGKFRFWDLLVTAGQPNYFVLSVGRQRILLLLLEHQRMYWIGG